jgi:hypothetical protein
MFGGRDGWRGGEGVASARIRGIGWIVIGGGVDGAGAEAGEVIVV